MTVVGLLSPGEMGAFVGNAMLDCGADVIWASEGRSGDSVSRATRLRDVGAVATLVGEADAIVSVCPPHAARDVASEVAAHSFGGTFVDANAVSPGVMDGIVAVLSRASVVDASIVGPPVAGQAVLFLAGAAAADIADLFPASQLEPRVLTGRPCGAASALKACFATATKARGAMLLTAAASAQSYDVYDELITSWSDIDPSLPADLARFAAGSGRKAWRFVGEMDDAAETARRAGLPDGYWLAAAETYRRIAAGDATAAAELAGVLDLIRQV